MCIEFVIQVLKQKNAHVSFPVGMVLQNKFWEYFDVTDVISLHQTILQKFNRNSDMSSLRFGKFLLGSCRWGWSEFPVLFFFRCLHFSVVFAFYLCFALFVCLYFPFFVLLFFAFFISFLLQQNLVFSAHFQAIAVDCP